MSYLALYRKFRPAKWDEVKGQDHIVKTLRNQIITDKIGHAYLFCGTRGTGKTTIAKLFARAINCTDLRDGEPCGECPSCKSALAGNNINIIEIDAASNNRVDDARALIEEVEYPPIGAAHKVYIIDEVHALTDNAFNTLLKTLEEPPEYVVFIFATTESQKILKTILSRCQRFDFHRIPPAVITARLKEVAQAENIDAEVRALEYIARVADGALRDALSLLDQCSSFYDNQKLTLDKVLDMLGTVDAEVFASFFDALVAADVAKAIEILDDVLISGKEIMQFTSDFIWYLRNMLLLKMANDPKRILDMSDENRKILKKQADAISEVELMRMINYFSDTYNQMRHETQKRVLFEISIVRVCFPSSDSDTKTLDARVRSLEEKELRMMNALKMIEEGGYTPVHAAPAGNQEAEPKPVKKLPKALPEEVKEIVQHWKDYFPDMPPSLKAFMQGPPEVRHSVDEAGRLLLILFNETHALYLDQAPQRESLERYLSSKTGKEVAVRIMYMPDQKTFTDQLPDLTDLVRMEVEVADDDDDDDE